MALPPMTPSNSPGSVNASFAAVTLVFTLPHSVSFGSPDNGGKKGLSVLYEYIRENTQTKFYQRQLNPAIVVTQEHDIPRHRSIVS
jgi:hypothetical protein